MSKPKFRIGQTAVVFVGNDGMYDGTVGTITAWEKKPSGNLFKLQPREGDARLIPETWLITYAEWQQKIVSGEAKEAIDRDTYTRLRVRGNGYTTTIIEPLPQWELNAIKGVTSGQRPARLERMAELFKQNMPTNFYFKVIKKLPTEQESAIIYEPGGTNWDLYIDFGGGSINIWKHAPEFMKSFVMWCYGLTSP